MTFNRTSFDRIQTLVSQINDYFLSPPSWWKFISEQLSQLKRPKLPGELRPHPAQLPARPRPETPAPVPLPPAQVCRQHPPLPAGPHTLPHPSEQLPAAFALPAAQPRSGSVRRGSVIPREAPLLPSSGETDIQAEERRASALSAPQEGPVSREAGRLPLQLALISLGVGSGRGESETQPGHLAFRVQEGGSTERAEPAEPSGLCHPNATVSPERCR